MKHRIRINGQVQEFDCELGSHVYDCNGREIFEENEIEYVRLDTELDNRAFELKEIRHE